MKNELLSKLNKLTELVTYYYNIKECKYSLKAELAIEEMEISCDPSRRIDPVVSRGYYDNIIKLQEREEKEAHDELEYYIKESGIINLLVDL